MELQCFIQHKRSGITIFTSGDQLCLAKLPSSRENIDETLRIYYEHSLHTYKIPVSKERERILQIIFPNIIMFRYAFSFILWQVLMCYQEWNPILTLRVSHYIKTYEFFSLYRLSIDLNKKTILIVSMIIFPMNISMLFIVNFGN
jgi:hypothetical protein